MTKLRWHWEADPRGVLVCLLETPMFGSARAIPFANWAARQSTSAAAVARLGRLIDDGTAVEVGEGVWVPHDAVAELDETLANSIGLPGPPPYLLQLTPQGLITDPDFALDARFVGLGGAPIRPAPVREGAILRQGGVAYRLPRPLPEILDAAAALAARGTCDAPFDRMAGLARLKSILPNTADRWVRSDGYLRTLRVAVPATFSLRLSTKGGQFDFDPILFGRATMDAAAAEGTVPAESSSLLPPVEDDAFRHWFRAESMIPEAYPLARGTYLFLPPDLRAALQVVRDVQRSDAGVREAFARQPHRLLKERLGDGFDPGLVDSLFIETEQYSERVLGLGLWQPPVLPWLVRAPNSWLPERFGLRIGEREIEIPLDRLSEVGAALDHALATAKAEADVPGIGIIPATGPARSAVAELERQLEVASEPDNRSATEPSDVGPGEKLVLLTKDNLEDVSFRRETRPRLAEIADDLPRNLASALKTHQKVGLRWLQECWRTGESGVLLADDMGLGKTLQALSFLAWLREAGATGPLLIVAPTGLLANWQAEEAKHLARPGLGELAEAFGSGLRHLRMSQGEEFRGAGATLDLDQLRAAGWILTTYETLRDHEQSFGKLQLACVVFDELQKAKNPASLIHKAVNALNADFALGLTGTPVENRIEDLWAVLEPLRPGELGDMKGFSGRHPPDDLGTLEALRSKLLDDAATRRAPVMRRLKADVLDGLPERHSHHRAATMPARQAEAYAKVVGEARAGRLDGLRALHHLRGISLHPDGAGSGLGDPEWVAGSARLKEAMAALDDVARRGEKALVFCESLDVLERLAESLRQRYRLPNRPAQITGEVGGSKRQAAVDAFQSARHGFDVMLLTPRAGGVGLTLTAANHVIHLSRWWNPAVEDQCTDRVYRIGQERPVHVWYPLALHPLFPGGSFDEALDTLLKRKRELTRRLLVPPLGPGDEAELLRATLGE